MLLDIYANDLTRFRRISLTILTITILVTASQEER
jgi:hypothetical protein